MSGQESRDYDLGWVDGYNHAKTESLGLQVSLTSAAERVDLLSPSQRYLDVLRSLNPSPRVLRAIERIEADLTAALPAPTPEQADVDEEAGA